jgi:hypothetical protein
VASGCPSGSFSVRPPPNRTCDFHRIRLSSGRCPIGRVLSWTSPCRSPGISDDGQGRLGVPHVAYLHVPAVRPPAPLRHVAGSPDLGLLRGLRRRGARARQAILSFPAVARIEHGLGRSSIPTPGLSHPVSRHTGLPVQRVHASTCGVAARSQHRGGSSSSPIRIRLRGVCPWPCRAGLAGRSPG